MASHKHNEIKERFWAAETSLNEEKELASSTEAEKSEPISEYLRFTKLEREEEILGKDFENEILASLEDVSGESQSRLTGWMGIAASLLLIIGLAFAINFYIPQNEEASAMLVIDDTHESPEAAFEEVKKALMMLSSNMNEGMDHTEVLGEFHRSQKIIETKN